MYIGVVSCGRCDSASAEAALDEVGVARVVLAVVYESGVSRGRGPHASFQKASASAAHGEEYEA